MTLATNTESTFTAAAWAYLNRLQYCFSPINLSAIETLARALRQTWIDGRHVYICGNGGSAANAIHLANDLHYGIGACGPGANVPGLRIEALPANTGVITCLANDTGYDNIYAHQLKVKGRKGDLLIVLSGSGNSANVVRALETANSMGITSFAILAFSGGRCRELADTAIHFEIDDMQVAEDTQLIVGHLCMQWLSNHKPSELNPLT
jgi:D-sedoheptulose 7-phosphate isomerase